MKKSFGFVVASAICLLPVISQAGPPPPLMPSVSVPEPGTILAGALMLVPLGVGAVRALRKSRQ